MNLQEVTPGTSLTQLELLEQQLSRYRARLHRRIDSLRRNGSNGTADQDLLERLLVEEREISDRRRELHREIDALRASVTVPSDAA